MGLVRKDMQNNSFTKYCRHKNRNSTQNIAQYRQNIAPPEDVRPGRRSLVALHAEASAEAWGGTRGGKEWRLKDADWM